MMNLCVTEVRSSTIDRGVALKLRKVFAALVIAGSLATLGAYISFRHYAHVAIVHALFPTADVVSSTVELEQR